jgi:pyruvate dehydrogenase E1 component
VDTESVVVGVLSELARRGEIEPGVVAKAISQYNLLDVKAAGVGTVGGDA